MKIKSFLEKLEKIAKDKETSNDEIIKIIETAFEKSYLKENPDMDIESVVNLEKEAIQLFEKRVVVDKLEDEIDDDREINLEDAQKIKKSYKLGDIVKTEVDLSKLEKRIITHFTQILTHNLNDISNSKIYENWKNKVGYIIKAEVEKKDNRLVEVNLDETKGVLLKADQIPGEELKEGQKYLFLIKEVKQQSKGWPIILSRADDGLLRFLLKNEISEISSGLIEIKKIARAVGFKSKVAIISKQPGIDAVATAVGVGGKRIKEISSLLNNEKIDIILYDEDPKQFLVNACHPEKITGVEITDDEDVPGSKIVTIVCPEKNLFKLIGKSGVNVRLLSKLTGWSVDIVSEEFAKESQIEYEDISHLVSSKVRQPRSSFAARQFHSPNNQRRNNSNNNNNKQNDFYNGFSNETQIDTTFDYDQYRVDLESITDDDVENLLSSNAKSLSPKKNKNHDEEEIVLFNREEKPVDELLENDDLEKKEDEVAEIFEDETNEEKDVTEELSDYNEIVSKKVTTDIDDIGSDDSLLQKKNKKVFKTFSTKLQKPLKEKKEKLDVFSELMGETEDIAVEENIDTSDLDNLELEDE